MFLSSWKLVILTFGHFILLGRLIFGPDTNLSVNLDVDQYFSTHVKNPKLENRPKKLPKMSSRIALLTIRHSPGVNGIKIVF